MDVAYKVKIATDFKHFLKMKKRVQDKFIKNIVEPEISTIREIVEKYTSKRIDWLQMINNQVLNDSKKTLDEKILIENTQLLEKLFELFNELEETWVETY